jgi:murein DD-endopeptidase MepM/ murein hydrolase activator NlpD
MASCGTKTLPSKKEFSFSVNSPVKYFNDSIVIILNNPINCPLRYFISSCDEKLNQFLRKYDTVALNPLQDSLIVIHYKNNCGAKVFLKNIVGNPKIPISKYPLSLPFKANSTYRVLQAYNGSYSHNDKTSFYAIDFDLMVGDTICSADYGYVVGVIKRYSEHGGKEWTEYANYIRLYHPASNLFTEYVHLEKDGSFVSIGDTVCTGQPIGVCGMTGFTNSPHLHFNVKRASESDIISEKINFIEGYKGEELKVNSIVKK